MRDVANVAGVSKAQTARALGGYGSVSDEVRSRVQQAAEEIGYRQNALARSVASQATHTIGVVVADISNPFFAQVVSGITSVLEPRGYNLFLADTTERVDVEVRAVEAMLDHRVDGLIMSPVSEAITDHLGSPAEMGCPLVLIDRTIGSETTDLVSLDHRSASRMVTEHFLEMGHRKIAFLSSANHSSSRFSAGDRLGLSSVTERILGFTEALSDVGVPEPERYVRLNALDETTEGDVLRELFEADEPPTAVVTSDSMVGAEVVRRLQELGRQVPEDIALASFDNSPWTTLTQPRVTVVAQPAVDLGVSAAELLLRRLDGDASPAQQVLFDGELLVRGSSGSRR